MSLHPKLKEIWRLSGIDGFIQFGFVQANAYIRRITAVFDMLVIHESGTHRSELGEDIRSPALTLSGPARADDPKNLEFKGVLVTPPSCSISNDGTVVTGFGDKVGGRKVASGIYRQDIEGLSLDCDENSSAWQLTVTGNAPGFDVDNATLATPEQADLGGKLLRHGKPFELGTAVKVNGATLPLLEAQLVQRPGSVLEEGPFTARATLRAGLMN